MTDSVRRRLTPLRDRPVIYVLAIIVAIMVISFAMLLGSVHHESQNRLRQLQDVICGVYVPIGNLALPPNVTVVGKTIVAATRHGAIAIHCPGVR